MRKRCFNAFIHDFSQRTHAIYSKPTKKWLCSWCNPSNPCYVEEFSSPDIKEKSSHSVLCRHCVVGGFKKGLAPWQEFRHFTLMIFKESNHMAWCFFFFATAAGFKMRQKCFINLKRHLEFKCQHHVSSWPYHSFILISQSSPHTTTKKESSPQPPRHPVGGDSFAVQYQLSLFKKFDWCQSLNIPSLCSLKSTKSACCAPLRDNNW